MGVGGSGVHFDRPTKSVKSSEPLFAVREAKNGPSATSLDVRCLVASLIGRLGSSTFKLSTRRMSMLLVGEQWLHRVYTEIEDRFLQQEKRRNGTR